MKKLFILSAFAMIMFACGEKKAKTPGIDAKKLYKQNCVLCHGIDGKLGLNNSKDLTVSPLTLDERISIIKNGKGAMTPFGAMMNADEIKAVAEYTFKLK